METAHQASQLRHAEELALGVITLYLSDPEPCEFRAESESLARAFVGDDWLSPDTRAWATALRGRIERSEPIAASSLGAELSTNTTLSASDAALWIASCGEKTWRGPQAHYNDLVALRTRFKASDVATQIIRILSAGLPLNGEVDELRALTEPVQVARLPLPETGTTLADLVAQNLGDADYLVAPLLQAGNLSSLQGEPKSGKSCFALYLAICAAAGVWGIGRFHIPRPRRVLFVTYEDGPRRVQSRARAYLSGLGCDAPPDCVILSHADAPILRLETAQGVSRLRALIEHHRAELVVIDTLSHLHGCDENSKEQMQPVMDALKDIARDFRVALLILHHTSKPGVEKKSVVYRSRGSSAIAAAWDTLIDWGDRGTTNCTPCRFESKDDDSDAWNVIYEPDDDGSIRWRIEDAEDGDASTQHQEHLLRVLGEMRATAPAGVKTSLLVTATHIPRTNVRRALDSLFAKGQIDYSSGPNKIKLYRIK